MDRGGTTAAPGFFEEQQAAAVLKHGIQRRYLHMFVNKLGFRSPDHRVFYLDAYAGAGTYRDGAPGSPMLAAQTAEQVSRIRNLCCAYVEADRKTYRKLCEALATVPHTYRTYLGEISEHLDAIMADAGDSPMLAFFDPFGLGISFGELTGKVLARSRRTGSFRLGAPTEVLLNFSLLGLRRNAGHLMSVSEDATYLRARETILTRLDSFLGGDWWRPIWLSGDLDREQQILAGYIARLRDAAGGWGHYFIPVANRLGARPLYYLLLLTQHRDGLWLFNEAVSNASEQYRALFAVRRRAALALRGR